MSAGFDKLANVPESLSRPGFIYRRRVDFADTDVGGIVHFSRFLVFMEAAEHEFLRSLGLSVQFEHQGRVIGWPRVDVHCRYEQPARFGDVLDIEVRVERRGGRSMTYGFRIRRGEELLADGHMTSVCCELDPGRPPRAISIPDVMLERLPKSPI